MYLYSSMLINILGTGCPKCKKLFENAQKAKSEADIEKVEDMGKILSYGVMMTPALVIDEKMMCTGRVATIDEIKDWLVN